MGQTLALTLTLTQLMQHVMNNQKLKIAIAQNAG